MGIAKDIRTDAYAKLREFRKKMRLGLSPASLRKVECIERAATKASARTSYFFDFFDGINLYVIIDDLESLTDERLCSLLSIVDDQVAFELSHDTPSGRVFVGYAPGIYVRVVVELRDPENSPKCRRVVDRVIGGQPVITYKFVCGDGVPA